MFWGRGGLVCQPDYTKTTQTPSETWMGGESQPERAQLTFGAGSG